MSGIQLIVVLYACILLSGAYFGWKTGSKISLIMGTVSGLLAFFAVYLIANSASFGYIFLSILSGLLIVVFLIRFVKTHKFMPAGMLLGVNSLVFALAICQLLKA